jgi:hypothetical protein
MMSRLVALVTLALLIGGAVAVAQDEAVQGVYEGSFTSGPWSGRALLIQMVATGEGKFLAVFPFGGGVPRVSVPGKREGDKTEFAGKVDLGATMGGTYEVTGALADSMLKGQFKANGNESGFEAKRVVRESPTLGAKPPEGAVVLLDGTNLDAWERWPLKWNMVDEGAMEVCGSQMVTKEEFGDCQLHLEFRTPFMPKQRPGEQGRGNSGVYVQGRYEIQVLDSFGVEPKDNLCGGIYKVAVPAADACAPPLQWQTYDITFTAPRFDGNGKKTENARITVVHNGVTIHDDLVLGDVTPGGVSGQEAPVGRLMLQDHGNPVRYRNTWIVRK